MVKLPTRMFNLIMAIGPDYTGELYCVQLKLTLSEGLIENFQTSSPNRSLGSSFVQQFAVSVFH